MKRTVKSDSTQSRDPDPIEIENLSISFFTRAGEFPAVE